MKPVRSRASCPVNPCRDLPPFWPSASEATSAAGSAAVQSDLRRVPKGSCASDRRDAPEASVAAASEPRHPGVGCPNRSYIIARSRADWSSRTREHRWTAGYSCRLESLLHYQNFSGFADCPSSTRLMATFVGRCARAHSSTRSVQKNAHGFMSVVNRSCRDEAS